MSFTKASSASSALKRALSAPQQQVHRKEATVNAEGNRPAGLALPTSNWGCNAHSAANAAPTRDASPTLRDGQARYQADFKSDTFTVQAGQSTELKKPRLCRRQGVPWSMAMKRASPFRASRLLIDWGWSISSPSRCCKLMDFFFRFFGNFVCDPRARPLSSRHCSSRWASKQYASMAAMKRVHAEAGRVEGKAWR